MDGLTTTEWRERRNAGEAPEPRVERPRQPPAPVRPQRIRNPPRRLGEAIEQDRAARIEDRELLEAVLLVVEDMRDDMREMARRQERVEAHLVDILELAFGRVPAAYRGEDVEEDQREEREEDEE